MPFEGEEWPDAVLRRAVFFGRSGAAVLSFVSHAGDVERYRADFDTVVDSFAFHPDQAWWPDFGWRLAAAGALVALLVALGIFLQRRLGDAAR